MPFHAKQHMEKLVRPSCIFYGIALIVYGIQQFVYSSFRPVFFPAWQSSLPLLKLWAWLFGIGLIAAGVVIIAGKKVRITALIVGGVFLLLFLLVQIPFEIISDPYNKHFGSWAVALKELALSGGAFLIAGAVPEERMNTATKSGVIILLEKLIPAGSFFFCFTITSFGIMHFMYTALISKLVPAWFPDPIFWTYFGAVALTGSGVAIILQIKTRTIAMLLGSMIFIWFVILHSPRAIADPNGNRGNELASVFDALAFTGIAFIIAATAKQKEQYL